MELSATRDIYGTDVAPPGLLFFVFNDFQGLTALATRPGPSGADVPNAAVIVRLPTT
jgi:hypothetical protein